MDGTGEYRVKVRAGLHRFSPAPGWARVLESRRSRIPGVPDNLAAGVRTADTDVDSSPTGGARTSVEVHPVRGSR